MSEGPLTRYVEVLRGVPDDESVKELAERNAQRCQAAIESLGRKWVLHPEAERIDPPRVFRRTQ